MQWPLRKLIEILVLALMRRVRAGTWEGGMGWMKVDQNGLAVPMEDQDVCREHDWMGISPPPNISSMIKYNSQMVEGMNCDFERPDECQWKIVPNRIVRKFGEDGLVRIEAHEKNYGKKKDGTFRRRNKGHYLIFQANYKNAAYTDCSPSFSHIESPWIEQSLPECILQFNFTTTVHPDDYQETNEHAYMEVTLSDKSHGVIPLTVCMDCTSTDVDKRTPWGLLQYKIGKWNKFKFDIAFFRGVNESKKSYFAIDDIQLINCLESPSSVPQQCNDQKEHKCNRTGKCYSKTMDLCDFHDDCRDMDDEENPICAQMDEMGSQYRCNFSNGNCNWTTSGKMRWSLMQEDSDSDDTTTNYMDMNMADYFNKDLVTVGMLRSPEMPPPPLYNDDDNSMETFQSCTIRLYLRIKGSVLNVDMFEIEVVENIPFTKVSRGNRVKKKEMIKIKDFLRDNGEKNYQQGGIEMTKWTKIEMVIPTGMKYRYFIQLSAIKSPDISGRQEYRLGVKDISFSPQCLGLGVPENRTSGCKKADIEWRHDMDLKELALCMDVPYPEEQTIGLDSFIFNSCGTNVGQYGPYKEECISYYESLGGNNTEVDMLDLATITSMDPENPVGNESYIGLEMKAPPFGIQKWVAPDSGIFTVIAKGASGGHGRLSRKSSHGAIIKAIIKLKRGDTLYILVGQEGESACVIDGVETREGLCSQMGIDDYRGKRSVNGKEIDGRGHGKSDKLLSRKAKRKKQKSRRNKIFQNSAIQNRKGPLEAIHLINKLNQQPEKMLADESRAFEPRSQYTRNEEDERSSQSSYMPYSSDSDNVTVNEYPEACTGDDCKDWMVKIKDFRPSYQGGGGGGGGGTFIFKVDRNNPQKLIPVIIAGGGGGMADISSDNNPDATIIFNEENMKLSEIVQDFENIVITAETRQERQEITQGGRGGGWNESTSVDNIYPHTGLDSIGQTSAGGSQHESWLGGLPCNFKGHEGQGRDFYEARWGGFGGGGGGCNGGGGGGGFIGGKGGMNGSENGEGGWSFVDKSLVIWHTITSGEHTGPGEVFIIPDISNSKNQSQCKCHDSDSLCLALSEDVADVNCYCSSGHLVDVNIPCNEEIPVIFVIILVIGCIVLAAIIGLLCMCLYTQYQRKRMGILRNKLQGANRFRNSNGIMMTEYNPNYEFAGGSCSLQDLKDLDRENLMLVKALGQGAFGEVYQGIFKNKTDSSELAVAVKTLPELSTNQAEMDFLMEALIMSKFIHPNIVHFIGVCFDKHPRFIILELLAGGDLKTFLRESRSKPDKPSSLTMRDLLNAAIDVAKGCSYLEENHFIHRDIAARNCLLTSKGPDRVVKIADFGMARDIYRADYYRKGGKAMLPVKWMPPEAFLDGIFTAKTDIWSFGILLWEVMSLGYMPYPGRANQEVMQLVTNGGRLEPPNYCPGPLYGLMCQCWHPIPEERPTFTTILERLGYCLQDPEVVMAPLPVFHRPQSITSHDTSLSSLRTGDCNSSGNSGSGGSVSIGPNASFKNNNSKSQPPTSDYLVPNLSSVTNLTTSPSTDDGLDTQSFGNTDTETSFTNPNSSSSITRGAYKRVPTEPPTSTSIHSQCKTSRSRWNSPEFPNEGVQESKSTEPLLPSPTSGSLDLTNIPPPCLYTDHVLPLNPARLTPSSYANVSRGPSIPHPVPGSVCDQRASLYAVSNTPYDSNSTRVESKTYPSSEISV